jgi:hypothetical protein
MLQLNRMEFNKCLFVVVSEIAIHLVRSYAHQIIDQPHDLPRSANYLLVRNRFAIFEAPYWTR